MDGEEASKNLTKISDLYNVFKNVQQKWAKTPSKIFNNASILFCLAGSAMNIFVDSIVLQWTTLAVITLGGLIDLIEIMWKEEATTNDTLNELVQYVKALEDDQEAMISDISTQVKNLREVVEDYLPSIKGLVEKLQQERVKHEG